MKHYYIIIAIVGCSAFPAPRPQFPLFGNQPNNTAPANGTQSPSNGFFSGLGGLVNNMMSSIWNFLPIPGRPNANQPQQLPGGIIALPDNYPPPPGMIPLPVSNGSGGYPSLLPPGAFDWKKIARNTNWNTKEYSDFYLINYRYVQRGKRFVAIASATATTTITTALNAISANATKYTNGDPIANVSATVPRTNTNGATAAGRWSSQLSGYNTTAANAICKSAHHLSAGRPTISANSINKFASYISSSEPATAKCRTDHFTTTTTKKKVGTELTQHFYLFIQSNTFLVRWINYSL